MAAVIDTVRYYAGWCDKITGQVIPARPDALTYTVREPVGVSRAMLPLECSRSCRHVEDRTGPGMRLHLGGQAGGAYAALLAARGPNCFSKRDCRRALSTWFAGRQRVGEALVQHPGVDKVTFTGSPKVGRGILQGAEKAVDRGWTLPSRQTSIKVASGMIPL